MPSEPLDGEIWVYTITTSTVVERDKIRVSETVEKSDERELVEYKYVDTWRVYNAVQIIVIGWVKNEFDYVVDDISELLWRFDQNIIGDKILFSGMISFRETRGTRNEGDIQELKRVVNEVLKSDLNRFYDELYKAVSEAKIKVNPINLMV